MANVRVAIVNTETRRVENVIVMDEAVEWIRLADDAAVSPDDPYDPDNFPPAPVEDEPEPEG